MKSDRSEKATINLTDMIGRQIEQVFDGKILQGVNEYSIDLSNLANGTYYVNVMVGNNIKHTFKSIKK